MSDTIRATGFDYQSFHPQAERKLYAVPSTLGMDSMAVFRSVQPGQLDEVTEAVRSALGNKLLSVRADDDHEHAVSILELSEPAKQKAIGNVAVKQAIEAVYDDVPSLRRIISVRPTGLALMSRKKHHAKTVALTFTPEDEDFFLDEREQILRTLEGLAEQPVLHHFDWLREKVPHISLGKVALGMANKITPDMVQPILDSAPSEIRVGKAVLYSPSNKGYMPSFGRIKNRMLGSRP